MSNRASPTLIGSFVVGAVALAVLGVVLFGSGRFFRKTTEFVVFFTGTVNGLKSGAAVKFKGVEVGAVKEILLQLPNTADQPAFVIPVIIELDEAKIRSRGGTSDLDNPAHVDALIESGLRAQLSAESLVTGVLYVALDLLPKTEAVFVGPPDLRRQEIPAIPTTMEKVQTAAEDLLDELRSMKLKDLVDAGTDTFESINRLVDSPKIRELLDELGPTVDNFNATLDSIRKLADGLDENLSVVRAKLESTSESATDALDAASSTLETAQSVLEPGSPLTYQLTRTLEDVAAASRAIRDFAEYLERNPSALLRGRELRKDKP